MSMISSLAAFGLRQVLGDGVENVASAVADLFRDHSQTLPQAIQRAHDRAWQSLGVALAGDGMLDRVKVFFSTGDDRGIREQVAAFLRGNAVSFDAMPGEFRAACLDDLRRLRRSGLLAADGMPAAEVARQAGGFRKYADGPGLAEGARLAVEGLADALAEAYPNLSRLLRTPTPGGPPLLVAVFCFFFRREVERDEELAHGLFLDGLRQLTASQGKAFSEVNKALATLGDRLDGLLVEVREELERARQAAEEARDAAVQGRDAAVGAAETAEATRGAVLDLQGELQRLGGLQLANAADVRSLFEQVLRRLADLGMPRGEVKPQHSFSVRGEDERRAVKALLARFRQLPPGEQEKVPALLNGLGKLQMSTGEFAEAQEVFLAVVRSAPDAVARAEASYNAYRAALERRQWDNALLAIQAAARLDPQRFTPFPFQRYKPQRILGAGGFGTVFLCHDENFRGREVAVKAIHADGMARGTEEVFAEAHALAELDHPAIIRVRDCDYAGSDRARPYVVMDYFPPGSSLEAYLREHGPLTPGELRQVALLVASGMKAAHDKGILHRDLKPDNVLVRREGDRWLVRVIDFGLAMSRDAIQTSAAAVAAGSTVLGDSVAGTLRYAPPEQMGQLAGGRRVPVGPYSDVFSFGKMCCYALFRTTEPKSRHWASSPEHESLKQLLESCIEEELEHRHPSFEPVVDALGVSTAPVTAPSPAAQPLAPRPPQGLPSSPIAEVVAATVQAPAESSSPSVPAIPCEKGSYVLWLESPLVQTPRFVHFSWGGLGGEMSFKVRDYLAGEMQHHPGGTRQPENGFRISECSLDRDEVWRSATMWIPAQQDLFHRVSDFDWWEDMLRKMTANREQYARRSLRPRRG